jgi:exonuclease SbcC
MTNFLCYGEDVAPLSFEAIHIACVSGDNGHGKSALIDAITWALWGQARTRSGDDLVKTGQNEMTVVFDFQVAGELYRVIRKHARPARLTGSGRSALELQMSDGINGFQTISGNTIAQTQQKITGILHMDYDTFINSALLLQGHADEFTRQTPARRKEVLARILGLAYYDELEEQARGRLRELDSEKLRLETSVGEDSAELSKKPEFEAAMSQAQAESARLESLVREQAANLDGLKKQRDDLVSKNRELERLAEDFSRRQGELGRWQEQAAQHRSRIEEYRELRDCREDIESGYLEFFGIRKSVAELEQKLRIVASLNERKHRLEMAVYQAQQGLNQEHVLIQHRIDEMELQAQKVERLEGDIREAQAKLDRLSRAASALEEKKAACQELRVGRRHMEEDRDRLARAKTEIEEKIRLLLAGDQTRCPLCETELGGEHIRIIEEKYLAEKRQIEKSQITNQDDLAYRRKELESLEAEIAGTEASLKVDQAGEQARLSTLNEQLRVVMEAAGSLAGEREKKALIEERLARKDFAAAEQRVLAELEEEINRAGYDAELYERERQRLVELEKYYAEKRRLEDADRLFSQAEAGLAGAETALSELAAVLETGDRRRKELAGEMALLPGVADELARVEVEYRTQDAEQRRVQERVVKFQTNLERCAELEKKLAAAKKRLADLAQMAGIYHDLIVAFGKRGVPAMLIETALPEIESEANQLLSRMTDGRMSIRIDSQKPTKTGEMAETLDIKIADELGTRNYEMFSGGEAFRINFALRIALSRLVAKRVEAPLPTLIIDEGFGTQDAGGIEKLKEAINSIQDDFEKILVVTHIDELKNEFESRIEVIRTEQGSNIRLN